MPAFRLTRAVSDDVAGIFIDGIERFGLAQADRYHDGLAAAFAFLADYPRAAREREEIALPVRIYPYRRSHRPRDRGGRERADRARAPWP